MGDENLSAIVTAVAAVGAAVLSGATLWITGRRAETAWFRSALIDALENYAQASFSRRQLVNDALDARLSGSSREQWAELLARRRPTHRLQTERLTRLRLLAHDTVVRAAEALLLDDDQLEAEVLAAPTEPTADEQAQLTESLNRNRRAKEHYVLAARRSMSVRGGVAITPMPRAIGRQGTAPPQGPTVPAHSAAVSGSGRRRPGV